MVSERIEVRLDPERREKLDFITENQDITVAEFVRQTIDREYDAALRTRIRAAADAIIGAEIPDDVPDIKELNRQLDEAHDPGIP